MVNKLTMPIMQKFGGAQMANKIATPKVKKNGVPRWLIN